MINILIDELSNQILGYNIIVDTNNPDPEYILVSDDSIEKLNGLFEGKSLYYIDGEIQEKNDTDDNDDIDILNMEMHQAINDVDNEYKIFMDNIINGMDISEASKISKENREKKEELEKRINELRGNRNAMLKQSRQEKIQKEEINLINKYYLSMLAIIRDENEYLVEWLDWHFKLGFEHFYIYDNESKVPIRDYLKSINYVHLNDITIMDWTTSKKSQQDAYDHFLMNYRNESKWILVADPDEFVYIKDNSKPLVDYLYEHENYELIKCRWKHFNANGYVTKTEGTQYERFTQTTDCLDNLNGGKMFAQTNRIKKFYEFTPQIRYVEGDPDTLLDDESYFQLNHYYTRSYEEWVEKMNRGTVLPTSTRLFQDFFLANPDLEYLNTGENYAQKYGSPVKENDKEDRHNKQDRENPV